MDEFHNSFRVLENVKEIWTEVPKSGKGKKKARVVNKERYISKVCFERPFTFVVVLER